MIAAIAIGGTIIAGFVAMLIPPKYTARAQLIVLPNQSVLTAGGVAAASGVDEAAIDTHITMLTERNHLRRVLASLTANASLGVDRRQIQSRSPATWSTTEYYLGAGVISELKHRLTVLWTWVSTLKSEPDPAEEIDQFERSIRVNQERRSHIITVRFTSKSPEKASASANRIVQLYVEHQNAENSAAPGAELERLVANIKKAKQEAAITENLIQNRLANIGGDEAARRQSDVPLDQLQRRAAVNAQKLIALLRRQTEVRNQHERTGANLRILSIASPPSNPSSKSPILFILPAMVLLLGGASLLAIILEGFDRSFRSERDVSSRLDVPCIGLIPKLTRFRLAKPHEYLLNRPFSPYAEAIRSIIASLRLTIPDRAPKVVLLSSSVPGEGKTTLAISLAVYAAHLQRRVLLIDLNFRRPAILRELQQAPHSDLVDLAFEDLAYDDVVRHDAKLGIDYLTVSSSPVDPMSLFANGDLPRILRRLGEQYDLIVMDGQSALCAAESPLLASLADRILFLVKWGSTRDDVAENALNELRNFGDPSENIADRIATIITQVNLKRHARYRFGDAAELFVRNRRLFHPVSSARVQDFVRRPEVEDSEDNVANLTVPARST